MASLATHLQSLVPAMGWTLAHFLWQGALVALGLQLLLRTSRTAKTRHDLALAALLLMAALPVATFAWLQGDVRIVLVPAGFPGLDAAQGPNWEAGAVAAWLAGVVVLAIRTAGGLVLIERLRRSSTPLPPVWASRCRALHARMAGSLNVLFAQSEAIATPLVAGWLKPMVLIPAAALTRFPADQLEALILHELAHVRRLDAFANLIQSVVETVLFYHPAVWWVSRRIRIEREHCCDDLAVRAIADPALYVRALQAMEAERTAPFGVLAASGGDLKTRAARILGLASAQDRPALSRTAAILVLTAAAAAVSHSAAVQAKPSEAPPGPPRANPVAEAAVQPSPTIVGEPRIVLVAQGAPRAKSFEVAAITAPAVEPATSQSPSIPATDPAPDVPRTVSPLVVSGHAKPPAPDLKIDMQGSADDVDQLVVIWPAAAYHRASDGHVTLSCLIDVHGLAERCEVASETPKNQGFGRAALELRPTFKLKPAMGPDGEPINAVMSISIGFKAPDFQFDRQRFDREQAAAARGPGGGLGSRLDLPIKDNPLPMRDVTMLDFPIWAEAATFDDLARAYPAKGGGVEGYAVAHCQVQRTGALNGCQIIKETPGGQGFGKAALGLAAKFKVAPQLAATHHSSPLWVDVPMRLSPPAQLSDRTVLAPIWITGVDLKSAPGVFPPEAVAGGVTTGRGVARCTVGPDGALTACAPEPGEPDGLGFSEAAAKLASTMKMNLWSADGAPVRGGVVRIPIRLNLKGG